jgi:tryptophan-rich sensory protein
LPLLLLFVGLALGVGALAAVFSPAVSSTAAQWYAALATPKWQLPQQWFRWVWAALYVTMGIAAWVIWRERYHRGRGAAIAAYTLQLLLNALWAPLFFGLKNIDVALFDIVALWLAIAWTIRAFARVRFAAAVILVPYFLWVSYAAAINLAIWRLNP